jgi:hypothetical protein
MKRLITTVSLITFSVAWSAQGAEQNQDEALAQMEHSHPMPDRKDTSGNKPMDHSTMDHGNMPEMNMPNMPGMFGNYPMTREASGTSWQPDSSPMDGMHAMRGDWSTMIHGFANAIYDHQGGPRGDTKTFSTSMLMLMGQRPLGGGTFGLRGMVSLDPLMGKSGYPLLLQTGETANGDTLLIDRQHPHDLFVELATSYSLPLSEKSGVFGYIGLPGEPALGPPAFMHRLSGSDNPEAPITHHWLDSTHITYGAVTLGYHYNNIRLEGSVFRGREPDQYRYNIESGKLDSTAVRLSYNPTPAWAFQASYGHIVSPEGLEADTNVNRTTASAIYNRNLRGNNWQTTFAWGRNATNEGVATDGYLLESAINLANTHTVFGRLERVGKNELFLSGSPLAGQIFEVSKLSAGYVYDFPTQHHLKMGIGGLVSGYALPSALRETYGDHPASYMLFARVKIQ